ncbi:hypothetical protein EGP91_02895 [bacterium]|nr:hypothetical protein [bacterium]
MISTSSYNDWKIDKYITYSISGDRGKGVNYQGRCYPELAPKFSFWKQWHDNIGKVSEEENNRYYVQEYWNQVLQKLNPKEVYQKLDNSILLCYESNDKFCHRHIVAAWFEILLGVKVPEQKAKEDEVEEVERPAYIKQYLEDVMRCNRNMKGFNSLRALYLFEKKTKLKALENESSEYDDSFKEEIYNLRCGPDEIKKEYNKNSLIKAKKI